MSRNPDRDAEIIKRYKAGATQQELATAYELTRARVHQILSEAGLSFKDSPNAPRGDRYAYIGVNVTKTAKKALIAKAARRGLSMSELVNSLIEKDLGL